MSFTRILEAATGTEDMRIPPRKQPMKPNWSRISRLMYRTQHIRTKDWSGDDFEQLERMAAGHGLCVKIVNSGQVVLV